MSSSDKTPLWGPQQPRIKRKRVEQWYSKVQYHYTQTRDPFTLAENAPVRLVTRNQRLCQDYCSDTVRNPKFRPFKGKSFVDDGGECNILHSHWEFTDEGNGQDTPWIGNTRNKLGLSVVLVDVNDEGFSARDSVFPWPSDYDHSLWQAKAYGLLRPDRPKLDLFVFFAELRDLFHFNFKAIKGIKDIADHYLALQFGWKPLLSDILGFIHELQNFERRLDYWRRNNGKPVRRSVQLYDGPISAGIIYNQPNIGITENTAILFSKPQLTAQWRIQVRKKVYQKVWASGEFVFYIDDIRLPDKVLELKLRDFGMNPSPARVWAAIPWTWLVDWFANVGDVLNNMSQQVSDRLVSNYWYSMMETSREYEWYGTDGYFTCSARHKFSAKSRRIGHPYGLSFGASLNARQFSILTALMAQKF